MTSHIQRVTVKGRTYSYLRPPKRLAVLGAKRTKVSGEGEAAALLQEMERAQHTNLPRFRRHLGEIFRKARTRATARKVPFTITPADIEARLKATGLYCEVSGIPFTLDGKTNGYRSPFRPSIDRIDARRGYEPGNIRIVCVAVNAALSDWGDAVFWTVVLHAAQKVPASVKRPCKTAQQVKTGTGRNAR